MMKTLLVQLSEMNWTMKAVHMACAMAHSRQATIYLLRLDHVRFPGYLGAEFGRTPPTKHEQQVIDTCTEIAAQYGVPIMPESIQCVSTSGALLTAVELYDAETLFAHFPATVIPFLSRLRAWDLERQLSALHCRLFTLSRPDKIIDYPSSITITTTTGPIRK